MSLVLSSKWGGGVAEDGKKIGLSDHLLASIFSVKPNGKSDDGPVVVGPLTDTNIELTANWQSPFEHAGAESKAPAIMAMLQSGSLESYLQAIFGKATDGDKGILNSALRAVENFSSQAQGRSGMTKLNSTQIFTGAAPIKITGTIHFRAYDDPDKEVQQPIDQLARWVLARDLAKSGSIVSLIDRLRDGQGFVKALLPSEAPQMLALKYGGYTFSPLVLESVGRQLTVPMTSKGEPLNIAIPFTMSSLTALDGEDWSRARKNKPTRLFNN